MIANPITLRISSPPHPDATPALETLARLLEYPGPNFEALIDAADRHLDCLGDAAAKATFDRFASALLGLAPEEREELYAATFDITPVCVPYVSIHLFGEENFKRGEFMAALNARYTDTGFAVGMELPDHLAVLLRYAARAEAGEQRELAEYCLLKPMEKMIAALKLENPCRALVECAQSVLRSAHPGIKPALTPLEQMRQKGVPCPTSSSACACGTAPKTDMPGEPILTH